MKRTDEDKRVTFRQVISIASIPAEGWRGMLIAPETALVDISLRIGALKLVRLQGLFELLPTAHGVRLSGALDAVLVRECVASLEPTDEFIDETFEITFSREVGSADVVDLDLAEDTPEPLENGEIDLAETLIQQLALAMDPYPRKPGAVSLADQFSRPEAASPFEILKSTIAGADEQG